MKPETRHKLVYLIVFILMYMILNYVPFSFFMDTIPLLIFRLCYYALMLFPVIYFKNHLRIEIEKPLKELHYLVLIPFLLPCLMDIIYCNIYEVEFNVGFSLTELLLEAAVDLFDSIVEDIIFVDVLIAFLFDIIHKKKKRNIRCMLFSAAFFSLIRCYAFIYESPLDAMLTIFVTAIITFACAYLAIYFDSALIPIIFHFLFNVPNFVIAPILFNYSTQPEYVIFTILFMVPLLAYTFFIYILSEKKYHRMNVEYS